LSRLSRRPFLLAALGVALAAPAFAAPAVPTPEDMSLGAAKARVQVTEYASLACPHCAHFNEEVFPAFKAKYVDTGRVHYTLKEFLTAPEEVAEAGFLLARCAGPKAYFNVVDQVFRSQPRWTSESIGDVFRQIGRANGVPDERFKACLEDEAARKAMEARVTRHYQEDGVDSTPTFFINGRKLEGAPTLAALDAAIAAAAKTPARAPAKSGAKTAAKPPARRR
jgi:protein-disulfide isomerase